MDKKIAKMKQENHSLYGTKKEAKCGTYRSIFDLTLHDHDSEFKCFRFQNFKPKTSPKLKVPYVSV